MAAFWQQLRHPIKREHADSYLRWLLVSFALSVIGIRVWLELTGYPQIGNDNLHIAHVLWGGLLLFVGALFPLIIANRFALTLSAILAGIGMGQFIDEIGKFITRTNDYFYAPAIPIIYGFFLLTVVLYLRIRRPSPSTNLKAELYAVFDSFEEILENDLEAKELALLKKRLRGIRGQFDDPNLDRLVLSLLAVVEHDSITAVQDTPEWWEKYVAVLKGIEERILSRGVFRFTLVVSFVLTGLSAFSDAVQAAIAFFSETARTNFLENLLLSGDILAQQAFGWFILTTILEGVIGVALLVSAFFLVSRREERAVQIGAMTLLLFLTTVNLLVLYFNQFQALMTSLFFFLLYLLTRRYHQRFIQVREDSQLIA